MSDLISRSALFSHIEREYRKWGEDYDAEQILGDIEDFRSAFDVDKVIAELEQERDNCYEQMKRIEEKGENETDYFDGHIFDEYHNQGIGLNKAIDIINKCLSGTAEPPKTD